jgi:hypothetical protein
VLRGARAQHGDVSTLRLTTIRPIVVVARAGEVEPLLEADPAAAHAGEARRRMLPMASPRSIFGGDGEQHGAARTRLEPVFAAAAIAARREAMAAIAIRHAGAWPRTRCSRAGAHHSCVCSAARSMRGARGLPTTTSSAARSATSPTWRPARSSTSCWRSSWLPRSRPPQR